MTAPASRRSPAFDARVHLGDVTHGVTRTGRPYVVARGSTVTREADGATAVRTVMAFGRTQEKLSSFLHGGAELAASVYVDSGALVLTDAQPLDTIVEYDASEPFAIFEAVRPLRYHAGLAAKVVDFRFNFLDLIDPSHCEIHEDALILSGGGLVGHFIVHGTLANRIRAMIANGETEITGKALPCGQVHRIMLLRDGRQLVDGDGRAHDLRQEKRSVRVKTARPPR